MLKFFGILILMSVFEYGSERDLWNTKFLRRALGTPECQGPDFSSIFDSPAIVCSHLSKVSYLQYVTAGPLFKILWMQSMATGSVLYPRQKLLC
eukprot:IDg23172t1